MFLTVSTQGFFKKDLVFKRNEMPEAVMRVTGLNLVLEKTDGAKHVFAFEVAEPGQSARMYWELPSGARAAHLTVTTAADIEGDVSYDGHTYAVLPTEDKKVFRMKRDGADFGTLTRRGGLFSTKYELEAAKDAPVEVMGFMLYCAMVYPAIRVMARIHNFEGGAAAS